MLSTDSCERILLAGGNLKIKVLSVDSCVCDLQRSQKPQASI
jgi:hypothetical protein